MKRKWLNSIAVVILLLAGNAGYAQATKQNAFSVKQCVDYAEKNSNIVKNSLLDIQIQKQFNKQVTSAAFPQVSASAMLNDYLDIPTSLLPGEIIGQPGTKVPVQFGTKYNANAGIDASQLLFDGQVFIGLMARKSIIEFQTRIADVTKEMIKANIYKIYYQLVIGKKQIGSLDANIERFDKLLHDTKEMFKNGFVERLDIDKVTVQLNNIKTEKIKAENSIKVGNRGLKFLMGMPQQAELILTDTLSDAEINAGILTESYSYEDRKEYQLLKVAERLDKLNIRRYKLTKLPTVSAFANYGKNAQRTSFDIFGKGDWFTTSFVGLKVAIPIFDGGKKNGQINQAKLELQKLQNNMSQFRDTVEFTVNVARTNFESALSTMNNQKKNIELAESVYNTTKKKFEQGLGSNQEIYNAQAELKMAQTNYYSSLYDAINARIDYLKAVGKL
jgi:outer membrane protein TolC